jgi:hypothetical protein
MFIIGFEDLASTALLHCCPFAKMRHSVEFSLLKRSLESRYLAVLVRAAYDAQKQLDASSLMIGSLVLGLWSLFVWVMDLVLKRVA